MPGMCETLILLILLFFYILDELDDIRRRTVSEYWPPFLTGVAECAVRPLVVCSLYLAGLTGRREVRLCRIAGRTCELRRALVQARPVGARQAVGPIRFQGVPVASQWAIWIIWIALGYREGRRLCHMERRHHRHDHHHGLAGDCPDVRRNAGRRP